MNKVPLPLFVAVNAGCNLRCHYCTAWGENRTKGGVRLALGRLMQVLEAAYASGIRTFRFTGGEPTLRRNLPEILLATQGMGSDVRIALTTNGARLALLEETLAELRSPRLFLSVDGLDPARGGADGEFRIEKWLTPALQDLLERLVPVASLRLNYVLTANSASHLWPLIDYAVDRGIDLKIFELLLRDFHYAGHRPRLDVFREQYVPVRRLLPELRDRFGGPRPFGGTGGRGIPMRAFQTGGSRIVYFDSAEGSHYGEVCRRCPNFPCQEGLYALVLDANGVLHPAGCVNARLRAALGVADRDALLSAFRRLGGAIENATLQRAIPDFVADGQRT